MPRKPQQAEPVLTDRQRDLALLGICPFCERGIRGHRVANADRRIDKLIAEGIDPMTGHRMDCAMPEVRL
jgi:hypothetical protein